MPDLARPRLETLGALDGAPLTAGTLETEAARVTLLSWGATLWDWQVRLGETWRPVALGLARAVDHPAQTVALGAICGPVVGRISGARFALDGRTHRLSANHGPHCLHGGPRGLGRRPWRMTVEDGALVLRADWPAGEAGFPGALSVTARLTLTGARLRWDLSAQADRPTPVNLAQHVYFNLDPGAPHIADHRLRLAAERWVETDADLIPTGRLRRLGDGLPDFGAARPLRGPDGAPLALDHAVVLEPGADPAADLLSPAGDLRLRLRTDRPCLQVYAAGGLDLPLPGAHGRALTPFAGLCLEAQDFPDAPNRPEFPSITAAPDRPCRQWTEVEIAPA